MSPSSSFYNPENHSKIIAEIFDTEMEVLINDKDAKSKQDEIFMNSKLKRFSKKFTYASYKQLKDKCNNNIKSNDLKPQTKETKLTSISAQKPNRISYTSSSPFNISSKNLLRNQQMSAAKQNSKNNNIPKSSILLKKEKVIY